MAEVILICGKIGCGKTTYAKALCREGRGVLLSVDEVMLTLFGQHCGEKHDSYAARTKDYLLRQSLSLVRAGVDVVLDWGFWTGEERSRTKAFFREQGISCQLHYLSVKDALWQERLTRRNEAVQAGRCEAYFVDENLARKFAQRFEEPDGAEIDCLVEA